MNKGYLLKDRHLIYHYENTQNKCHKILKLFRNASKLLLAQLDCNIHTHAKCKPHSTSVIFG